MGFTKKKKRPGGGARTEKLNGPRGGCWSCFKNVPLGRKSHCLWGQRSEGAITGPSPPFQSTVRAIMKKFWDRLIDADYPRRICLEKNMCEGPRASGGFLNTRPPILPVPRVLMHCPESRPCQAPLWGAQGPRVPRNGRAPNVARPQRPAVFKTSIQSQA